MDEQRMRDLRAARVAEKVIAHVTRKTGEDEGARRADVLAAVGSSLHRDDFDLIASARRLAIKHAQAGDLTSVAEHLQAEASAS